MHKYAFEKLDVWNKINELVLNIYRITNEFPKSEQFGLTSQIRRAVVSVSNNIVEGSGRKTAKDQANFSTMAYSSNLEVLNLIMISEKLGYISNEEYLKIRSKIEEISYSINGLRNSQLARKH